MEWKIGEIKKVNGEWYQCIVGNGCKNCAFNDRTCYTFTDNNNPIGDCSAERRTDKYSVIFKKLEKVGEPYMLEDKKFQKYLIFKIPYIYNKIDCSWQSSADPYCISLEIKQNQEDMEEKKIKINEKDAAYLLNKLHYILDERLSGEGSDEVIDNIKQILDIDTEQLNLKSFNLEEAKAGKPVCTRNGKKARIICFDLKNEDNIIVAAVGNDSFENLFCYTKNGKLTDGVESDKDLMMLTEKKEGWVNIYRGQVYNAFEKAEEARKIAEHGGNNCLKTIKIDWEE